MLMLLTCIAVIVYFARNRLSTNIWRTTIAPALGGCGLLFALVIMTMNFPVLIGDLDPEGLPRFGVLSLVFMAIMLAFPVFGLIQAAALRSRKPHNYRQIIDTMGAVTQHP